MAEISYEELSKKLNDFIIIDVRKPDEVMESGKIPGSFNLPLQELEDSLSLSCVTFFKKYGFPSIHQNIANIVISCRSGRRVDSANSLLQQKGFSGQRLYKGSFQDWQKNGGHIERFSSPTTPNLSSTEVTEKQR